MRYSQFVTIDGSTTTGRTLRERKRERTRAAIIEAGTRLFETNGYDETTIAAIAGAADIGARTFFSYFESKEELLFPESADRMSTTIDAIRNRSETDTPADVLFAALVTVGSESDEMFSGTAGLRLRLAETVPAVRARATQLQQEASSLIARELCAAFPQLDSLEATALVGAFVGAITAALQHTFQEARDSDPSLAADRMRRAVARVLGVRLESDAG